jgi:hypothetical protein
LPKGIVGTMQTILWRKQRKSDAPIAGARQVPGVAE